MKQKLLPLLALGAVVAACTAPTSESEDVDGTAAALRKDLRTPATLLNGPGVIGD
jgi:hypothetical protein